MIPAAGLLVGTQGGYLHNPYSRGGREKSARRAVMKSFEGLRPVLLQYSHCVYDDIDALHPSLPDDRIEIARVIHGNTGELLPSSRGWTFSYRAPHFVPSRSQGLSDVAADETGGTCDQYFGHLFFDSWNLDPLPYNIMGAGISPPVINRDENKLYF